MRERKKREKRENFVLGRRKEMRETVQNEREEGGREI
jgi:hypothetical protein